MPAYALGLFKKRISIANIGLNLLASLLFQTLQFLGVIGGHIAHVIDKECRGVRWLVLAPGLLLELIAPSGGSREKYCVKNMSARCDGYVYLLFDSTWITGIGNNDAARSVTDVKGLVGADGIAGVALVP